MKKSVTPVTGRVEALLRLLGEEKTLATIPRVLVATMMGVDGDDNRKRMAAHDQLDRWFELLREAGVAADRFADVRREALDTMEAWLAEEWPRDSDAK